MTARLPFGADRVRRLVARRWPVLVVAVVAAVLAALVARESPPPYRSNALLVVPTSVGDDSALDLTVLASTFAEAIPQDDAVIGAVERALGAPAGAARGLLAADHPNNTLLVWVSFSADDPRVAQQGAAAAVDAIAGRTPVARSVPEGELVVARGASAAARPDHRTTKELAVYALLLGLGAGVLAMVAWDRADRRIDTVEDAVALIGAPAAALDGDGDGPGWDLAAVVGGSAPSARDVAAAGLGGAPPARVDRAVAALREDGLPHVRAVRPGHDPGVGDGGALIALVPRGASARQVERELALVLPHAGRPACALLL